MLKLSRLFDTKWKKVVWAVLVSIVGVTIYSYILFSVMLFFGLFAMGCGGSCSTSKLPLIVLSVGLFLVILFLFIELKVLQKILKIVWWKSALWILLSFIAIPFMGWIISTITFNRADNYAKSVTDKEYAPFFYAQKMSPKVTVLSVTPLGNDDQGRLTGIDVKLSVSASNSGDVTINGELVDSNLDDGFRFLSHRLPAGKINMTLGRFPAETNLRIMAGYKDSDNVDLRHFDSLVISMFYNGKPEDYTKEANLDYNPVDNVMDSGNSILKTLPYEDDAQRSLIYSIDLNK